MQYICLKSDKPLGHDAFRGVHPPPALPCLVLVSHLDLRRNMDDTRNHLAGQFFVDPLQMLRQVDKLHPLSSLLDRMGPLMQLLHQESFIREGREIG